MATDVKSPVVGSQMLVLNVPAAKSSLLLPDPATMSTLPVCISAMWAALTGDGFAVVCHDPWQAVAITAAIATPHATRACRPHPPMARSMSPYWRISTAFGPMKPGK